MRINYLTCRLILIKININFIFHRRRSTMPFQHKKALQNYVPKQIPAENKKGYKTEYIYQGDWYVWDCEPKKLRFFRICSLTTAGLIAGFFLAGALQRTFCNTISFVAVPSLLSIVALMLGTYGLFSPFYVFPGFLSTIFVPCI